MLVFRRKRAPPGPTQVPCPVPLAALRTPPDHTCESIVRDRPFEDKRGTPTLSAAISQGDAGGSTVTA